MPTILELVDIPVPPELQGQSLLPLLDEKRGEWKDKNAPIVKHLSLLNVRHSILLTINLSRV